MAKLTKEQKIKKLYNYGIKMSQITKRFGITEEEVLAVVKNKPIVEEPVSVRAVDLDRYASVDTTTSANTEITNTEPDTVTSDTYISEDDDQWD